MSRRFFAGPIETVASWWRIYRRDGVALGFTTHDRPVTLAGIVHRAAPGLLPSAIRLSTGFGDDDASVEGALSHAAIRDEDLTAGRYDGARIEIGVADWQSGDAATLYAGTIAGVARDGVRFTAELQSLKTKLAVDPIPRTGPSCRARFAGPGCDLNPARFERRAVVTAIDPSGNTVTVDAAAGDAAPGLLKPIAGPQAGDSFVVLGVSAGRLVLDRPLSEGSTLPLPVILRAGCDGTIATCAGRFGNAANFRGEPFVPGADILAQYPVPR